MRGQKIGGVALANFAGKIHGRFYYDERQPLSPSVLAMADPAHQNPQPRDLRTGLPHLGASPHEGVFTEQAVAYYEERAQTGIGMIILGGHLSTRTRSTRRPVSPDCGTRNRSKDWRGWRARSKSMTARSSRNCCTSGCDRRRRFSRPIRRAIPTNTILTWSAPSQMPVGEMPGSPTPKEIEEHEIEYMLECFAERGRRAMSAGLDGIEFHLGHGYLPWQFLSPLYNHRTDRWGGSYENRLRFSLEAMPPHSSENRRPRDPRLSHQLDLVLGRRSRDRGRQARSRRSRAADRHRLRQRVGRSPSLVDPHADDLRAGMGARILRAPFKTVSMKPVLCRRPHQHSGRRRRVDRLR